MLTTVLMTTTVKILFIFIVTQIVQETEADSSKICSCGADEYCCNNSRCIRKQLQCKGHDPCGDGSDCPEVELSKVTAGSIVVIVFSVVALLIAPVGTFATVFLVRRVKRDGSTRLTQGDLNLPVTTTTNPVTPSAPATTAVADSADLRVHLPDPSSSSPPSYRSLASVTQNGHGPANTMDRHFHSHFPRHSPRHSPSHAVDEDNACYEEEPPPTYNKAIEHSDLYTVRGHSAYI